MKQLICIVILGLGLSLTAEAQVEFTGKASYLLTVEGNVGAIGGDCGTDVIGGLQWVDMGFESGKREVLLNINNSYPNGGRGLRSDSFSAEYLFTEEDLVSDLEILTSTRSETWIDCRSAKYTKRAIQVAVCNDSNIDFGSIGLNQSGNIRAKISPQIEFTTKPDIESNFITDKDELIISLEDGIDDKYYNWEYAIGNSTFFRKFSSEFNNKPVLKIRGADFLGFEDIGKNVHIRINTNCNDYKSEVLTFQYVLHAPKIIQDESVYTQETCYQSGDAMVRLKFERALYDRESLYWGIYEDGNLVLQGAQPISIDPTTLMSQPIGPFANGELSLGVYGTYRTASDTVNTYTTGPDYRASFTIVPRRKVVFSLEKSDVLCHAGANGTVRIMGASGGTGAYSVLLTGPDGQNKAITMAEGEEYSFEGLEAGRYTVSLRDSNGCVPVLPAVQTVTISQPMEPLAIVETGHLEPKAYGVTDGMIWAYVRGGTLPYAVVWKDEGGQELKSETLTSEGAKTSLEDIGKGRYYLEIADGQIESASTLGPTDTQGCVAVLDIEVDEPPALELSIEETQGILCHGDQHAELVAHARGGQPDHTAPMPYRYDWVQVSSDGNTVIKTFPSLNDSIISGLGTGYYQVTVTDTNAIALSAALYHLAEPAAIDLFASQSRSVSCHGGSDGQITIRASGGTGTFKAQLSRTDDPGFLQELPMFGTDEPQVVDGLAAGEYSIHLVDENNCEAQNVDFGIEIVEILQPDAPLSISGENFTEPLGFGRSDGLAWAYIHGGTSPYTATWKNKSGQVLKTETLSGTGSGDTLKTELTAIPTGEYTLMVTDAKHQEVNDISDAVGCLATVVIEVKEPPKLTVQIEKLRGIDCFDYQDGALVAHASGGRPSTTVGMPYSYLWKRTSSDGQTVLETYEVPNDSILSNLPSGYYQVTVQDRNQVTAVTPIFHLEQPEAITLRASVSRDVHCYQGADGQITLAAVGGSGSYRAQLYMGQSEELVRETGLFGTDSTVFFTGLAAGNYEIRLQDENGCIPLNLPWGRQVLAIGQPSGPLALSDASAIDPLAFGYSDGKISVTIQGGTAPYMAIWKDQNGRVLKSEQLDQEDPNNPVMAELAGISKGQYALEVFDSNRQQAATDSQGDYLTCEVSMEFVLHEPPKMAVNIEGYHYITCYDDQDGQLVAHASGGAPDDSAHMPYRYDWYQVSPDSSEVLEHYVSHDSLLVDLHTGYYTVSITDTNNILLMSPIYYLEQPAPLRASVEVLRQLECDGAPIGQLRVIVEGGTPPYSYEWETGDTTQFLSGLEGGIYAVFVRDARFGSQHDHACAVEAFGEIRFPDGMEVEGTIVPPKCSGSVDGQIVLDMTGGAPPYSFSWSNGATTKDISGLAAGEYTVTARDAQGCTLISSYMVPSPVPISVDLGGDFTLCQGQFRLLDGSSDLDDITYTWTKDGQVISKEAQYTVSEAGTYRLTISNSMGCTAYDEVLVSISDVLIDADFVVPTVVAKDQALQAVNISVTDYDEVRWLLPENAQLIEQDDNGARFSLPALGNYTVGMELTHGACSDVIYKAIEVKNANEVDRFEDEQPLVKKLLVLPNPNDGVFSALVELSRKADYDLYLYNGQGILLRQETILGTMGTQTEFDISNNGSGTFLLRLISGENTAVFKIAVR